MKITYEWTRDDLKKKLKRTRLVPNIVLLLIGGGAYFVIANEVIVKANPHLDFELPTILVGFLIYMTILAIFIFLTNHLSVFLRLRKNDKKTSKAYGKYTVETDSKGVRSRINDMVIGYKWDEITRFKKTKDSFFVSSKKDKIGLLFCKGVIPENEYEDILAYVEKKLGKGA